MNVTKLLLIGLSVVLIYSCKKEKLTAVSPSYHYFPTDYGKYVVYSVDSVVHGNNDVTCTDDSVYYYHFQIKDVIDSNYVDGEGKTRQLVVRYYRPDTGQAWAFRSVGTQLLTSSAAYRYEDNVAYHKLAFPIKSSTTWNGNDMNTLGDEEYSYQGIHQSFSINGLSFDSTLDVLQINQDDFIETIYGEEIYAANVGLVYKRRDNLGKCNGHVTEGTLYKMTAIDYGPR